MERLFKKLDYLIPLFIGMPTWLKWLCILWIIFSLVLSILVICFRYSKNEQKALEDEKLNLEFVTMKVNRLIEDFDDASSKIVGEYPKVINQIKQYFNSSGSLDGSAHLRRQYDTAINYKNKIDDSYKKLIREIEDIMLQNFKNKDINRIPQMHEQSKQIKDLGQKYEEEKKKFEEAPRRLDLQIHKNSLIINENFEMIKY